MLDTRDGDVVQAALLPLGKERVVDLTRAEDCNKIRVSAPLTLQAASKGKLTVARDVLRLGKAFRLRLLDVTLERRFGTKLLEVALGLRMPEQVLRRENKVSFRARVTFSRDSLWRRRQ